MKITIRNLASILVLSTATLLYVPPILGATAAGEAGGQFGSSAVWHAASEHLAEIHQACDALMTSPGQLACVVEHMKASGAPADAIQFTHALFMGKHQIGIMGAYKSFTSLGLAWVVYPFRPEAQDGLLFVNCAPNFLDPNDLSNLDRAALEKDTTFQTWNKTAMNLRPVPNEVPAGERQVEVAHSYWGDKPGAQNFLFSYRLAGASGPSVGFANYYWMFDANGKFLGTKLLSVAHGVPPARRGGATPAAVPSPPPSPPHY